MIYLDFETYFDSEYSLSNMTTAQYILDSRFEPHILGYKIDNEPTKYVCGPDEIDAELSNGYLRELIENNTVAAHHVTFDASVLAFRYELFAPEYYCTRMAAQAILGPVIGSVSLAEVAKFFKLKDKGDALVKVKGQRWEMIDPLTNDDYIAYCMHDVDLCSQIARILRAWNRANVRNF